MLLIARRSSSLPPQNASSPNVSKRKVCRPCWIIDCELLSALPKKVELDVWFCVLAVIRIATGSKAISRCRFFILLPPHLRRRVYELRGSLLHCRLAPLRSVFTDHFEFQNRKSVGLQFAKRMSTSVNMRLEETFGLATSVQRTNSAANPSATSAGQYPWLAACPCPGYASRLCKLWWNASQTSLKAGTNPKLMPSLRQ